MMLGCHAQGRRCLADFAWLTVREFCIKNPRRQVAPGAPVGNTGLASPILTGGGIKETRHRCAMCGFFMEACFALFHKKPGASRRRVSLWAIQDSNL